MRRGEQLANSLPVLETLVVFMPVNYIAPTDPTETAAPIIDQYSLRHWDPLASMKPSARNGSQKWVY